jgi:hypothetical protein
VPVSAVEAEEVADIFRGYGLTESQVQPVVAAISADPSTWTWFPGLADGRYEGADRAAARAFFVEMEFRKLVNDTLVKPPAAEEGTEPTVLAPGGQGITVLGPAPAPLALLRGRHRHRLLLKAERGVAVQPVLREWLARAKLPPAVRVQVDIDPVSFL